MAFSPPASSTCLRLHLWPCLRSVWQNPGVSRAAKPLILPSLALSATVRNKHPVLMVDFPTGPTPAACSGIPVPCVTHMHSGAHACTHIPVHTPVHMNAPAHMCTHMQTCAHSMYHVQGAGPIMPVGLLSCRDFPYTLQPNLGHPLSKCTVPVLSPSPLLLVDCLAAGLEAPLTLNLFTRVSPAPITLLSRGTRKMLRGSRGTDFKLVKDVIPNILGSIFEHSGQFPMKAIV